MASDMQQSSRKLLPRPEHPLSRHVLTNQEEKCEVLSSCSDEYNIVEKKIKDTLTFITIIKIEKVYNPYLKGCYLLKKAECESRVSSLQEKTLFHATNESSINNSIIKDNLDWRRSQRCKFGHGVSFANTAKYANKECSANRGPRYGRTIHRAMIIAKVLVGNCIIGNCYTLLNKGYDTTTSNNNAVYVKYYDNEFYPEYIVYYIP